MRKKKKTHAKTPLLGRLLALVPVGCVLLYPFWLGAQLYLVKDTVVSAALPHAFDGLTIAFASDIHYGPYFNEARLQQFVEKMNALDADIIILGGDYGQTSDDAVDFFHVCPPFHAKYGVYATVGNHDRTLPEKNLSNIRAAMLDAGITPIVNDAVILDREGQTLAISSIDDVSNGHPDIRKTAQKTADADYTIFAPHSPDVVESIDTPFFDLLLCGHTHGGQVTLFGHALKSSSEFGDKYLSGWKKVCGADMLISNGVGMSFLPVRLGAKPQYHLITLKCVP